MGELVDLLFGLKGRIDRGTWWAVRAFGIMILFSIGLCIYVPLESPELRGSLAPSILGAISTVVCTVSVWIDLATTVKRWHDRDHSGWMYFIRLIPIVGPIWTLVECGFLPGVPGSNRYGPSPASLETPRRAPA